MNAASSFMPTRRARETQTLRNWAKRGRIECLRTSGGHRLYNIEGFISEKAEVIDDRPRRQRVPAGTKKSGIVYARVSSAHQKDDLVRQVAFLHEQFPEHKVITDIASGINFKRRGLTMVVEQCMQGGVPEVVVAHRDRLARFGVDLIETVFARAGTKLRVLDSSSHAEPQQQLAEDLMSIVQVFACKRNGKRRYGAVAKGKDEGNKGIPKQAARGGGSGNVG